MSDSAQDKDARGGAQPVRRGDTAPAFDSPLAPKDAGEVRDRPGSEPSVSVAGVDHLPDSQEPSSAAKNRSLIGSVLAGRYRVDELLGSGGMGSVYRAEHVHMRKAVAIKVLHREMTFLPEVVARFEREAVAAGRIEHPNVAAATDFGRLADGSFYLVLEYVEGRSLRDLMQDRGPLEAPEALHIARQIAEALSAAHAAGVVHRDLKPENILLVERDGDPVLVKVLDFGIAKVNFGDTGNQPALTQLGSVFGTPEYMSPEQAAGQSVDSRADLYTVGVLLYEMLTEKTPFGDEDLVVVLTRQMTMDPPPLPQTVDPAVAELVMALLVKDPEVRVPSADKLVERIDAVAENWLTPGPVSLGAAGSKDPPPASATAPSREVPAVEPAPTRPSAVLDRLHDALERALREGRRTVRIGGQPFSLWMLAALGAGAFLLTVFVAMLTLGSSAAPVSSAARSGAPPVAAPPPALSATIARAGQGDREAIASLRARPDAERTAAEWFALGRGYSKLQLFNSSLAAYQHAARIDPKLAADRRLLEDVRSAALRAGTADAALALAAHGLGSSGIDLLYDLSSSNVRSERAVTDRAKKLLDDDSVAAKASPELSVALALKHARGCSAYKKILPDAAAHADARSLTSLRRLTASRGCGFLGLGDCFSCLRGDHRLRDAIHRAESHPAPKF